MPAAPERFGFDLGRLARQWRLSLDERLAPLGLTQARWTVLLHLARAGGAMAQRDLAESIGVEGPTLVRGLDGLERQGLIERRETKGDRRSKTVHLTAAATPLLAQIDAIATTLRAEVLGSIDPEELARCHAVLGRIGANLAAARKGDRA